MKILKRGVKCEPRETEKLPPKSSLCLLGDLVDSTIQYTFPDVEGNAATGDRSFKLLDGLQSSFAKWTPSDSLRACPSPVPSPTPHPCPATHTVTQSVLPLSVSPSFWRWHWESVLPPPRTRRQTLTQVRGQADRVVLHPERSGHWNMKRSRGSVTRHWALGRCI